MGRLYDLLLEDFRFRESLTACMNCGVCTAICPAAEFYPYDPRKICEIVQRKNEEEIEQLLRSETIWYCGECMSCKSRCPRGNTAGMIIVALRGISQKLGYFCESEKGRQQYVIRKAIGSNILERGYCVHPDTATPEMHPEQGPIWKWYREHLPDISDKLGANYGKGGKGALRAIEQKNLDEIKQIFEVTGALDFFEKIDKFSANKMEDMSEEEYTIHVYTHNNGKHHR